MYYLPHTFKMLPLYLASGKQRENDKLQPAVQQHTLWPTLYWIPAEIIEAPSRDEKVTLIRVNL